MTDTLPFPVPPPAWGERFARWFRSVTGATSRGDTGSVPRDRPHDHTVRTGPPAINELYHARRLSLVRLAVLMVDDLPTAEDIVQDVFAALYRRHGADLRTVDDPHRYLTAGVMNAARSALRRRRSARANVPPPAGTAPAAEDQVLLGEPDREVLAALGWLTVRQRQVIVLRYWSELSEREIAEALRISRGTVKSTASRALHLLREILGEDR
jgi:RNA polymerase sigma factor (sigma-70 family)